MFKNHIKIAWRKIKSQRFYAIINILGLAIGISSCLLITLLVVDELSYDRFHEQAENIYRVAEDLKFNGERKEYVFSPALLADALRSEIPEVIEAVRFRTYGTQLLRREGTLQNFKEDDITYVDHEVFDIFTIPILEGDPTTVLKEPNTLVLTTSAARKYFGNANPVGESMILDDAETFKVVGVCEDLPANSHFQYDVFLSAAGLEELKNAMWLSNNAITYFLARPDVAQAVLEEKANALFRKYAAPEMQQIAGTTIEEFEAAGNFLRYNLQPLTSIHLQSNMVGEHEVNGNLAYVQIFGAIAIFILLIACINFMNLATARSAHRALEVGMRKVLGSGKKELVRQFLTESVLMTVIAFSLALLMSWLALPAFNELTNKSLSIPLSQPIFLGSLVLGILVVGLISGSYPAFFLAAFEPLKVIKGKMSNQEGGNRLRQVLVTAQFTISIVLMIGTGITYSQLQFLQEKRLGFEREQVMILRTNNFPGSFEGLQNQLKALPEVQHVSATCYLPVDGYCEGDNAIWEKGKNAGTDGRNAGFWFADYGYVETLGMSMAAGRYFSKDFKSDSSAIVVNEAFVDAFGWEDPINKQVEIYGGEDTTIILSVIGVLKNFNFDNLRSPIEPLAIQLVEPIASTAVIIRFDAQAGVNAFVDKVSATWEATAPNFPFEYTFLDSQFDEMYESDQRLGQVLTIFAGLAIFIACLGLLALAAFTAERRRKEIGIRKVLGAGVHQLVALLSKEFLMLVTIAILIAVPIAYYFMNEWLQDFAYRIELQWWVFALAGVVAIGIALLTVSFQSVKAALANPVNSLRSE
ncbi:MAG: ABC transporter permease [Bacteroidota bacterium]